MASTSVKAKQIDPGDVLKILGQTNDYKIQFGETSLTSVTNNSDNNITLPTAWGTQHLAFFASLKPLSSWTGVYMGGCFPHTGTPLTTGSVHIFTGSTQNFTVYWISIGY